MANKTVDYIIVGQGLAGTLLAHFLLEEQQHIHIYNKPHERAATKVAAGIINPITGRRYVKSWRVDELIPFAKQTYQTIEERFQVSIYHPRNILRTLFNHREENDWLARSGEPGYIQYIKDPVDLEAYATKTLQAYSYGEVTQSAQVNVGSFANAYRNYLLEQDLLTEEAFNYEAIEFLEDGVRYQGVKAKKIIFAEGYYGQFNPYFSYLPFGGAKGEVLIVRIPDGHFEKLLKHRVFIVPLQDELYWIGATYDWKFEDDAPTKEGGDFLKERLSDFLQVPFEIVKHTAAIRPTVKDRRPFLGLHPEFPQFGIFNGLGTKGASLGPFWAKQMTDFLLGKVELDEAVQIARFKPK